jgi:hypothetical protein
MALLARSRSYWQASEAAQESIGQVAQPQEILERTDELRTLRCAGGILKVGPVRGDQRLTAVRQNEHELQAVWHAGLPKNLQRLSFEWVMRTRDEDAFREVLMVGSVSWCPSIESITTN